MATPRAGWRPVPGFECSVSAVGEVKSHVGAVLVGWLDKDGYRRVHVRAEGRYRHVPVHTLVCLAFHGPRPTPEHQAAHGDGRRPNNDAGNLRWATPAEQYDDRRRHGTAAPTGEANWSAKLTDAQAAEIRAAYRPRSRAASYPALARRYGVSKFLIYRVVRRGGYAA
jgi:hypothetical protein